MSVPSSTFQGFSPLGLDFLRQVVKENSKDWFESHRGVYQQHLLTPFRALVETLAPAMLAIDDRLETRPAVGKTLSRMYRDTRFSNDKALFRNRMWLTFKRTSKEWTDAPVFFFEITPDYFHYGLGYYSASRATMDRFRHLMLREPQVFAAAAACARAPFQLAGDSYKRPLLKDQDPALANWYNRKTFAVMATDHRMESLFSPALSARLSRDFARLRPLYALLMQVEMLKQIPLEDL